MIDANGRSSPGWIVATLVSCVVAVLAVLIATAFAVVLLSRPAAAQNMLCLPWPALKEAAASRHGERPVSRGQLDDKAMLVVLASPGGSTTVAVVGAAGMACVIATGIGWEPGRLPQLPIETRRS